MIDFFVPEEIVSGPEVVFRIAGIPIAETVVTTWIIMALFFIVFYFGIRNLKMVPGKVQSLFEILYEAYNWIADMVIKDWKKVLLPYLAAILSYLAVANTITLIPLPKFQMINDVLTINPAFKTPTSDINTPIALAIISTIAFLYYGINTNGIGKYLKESLFEPNPFLFPMNIIGEISKPVNISMRLFGNMLAGMVIMGLLYNFSTNLPGSSLLIVPLHLYFDIFAGVVQSFIFTMLTMVYVSMAIGDNKPE